MDSPFFDRLVTSLGRTSSRKQAVGLLAGGLVGGLAAVAGRDDAAARSRKRRKTVRTAGMAGRASIGDTREPGDTGGTMEPGTAEMAPQNSFVRTCRANGGTSTSVRTRVVKCCYTNHCTTCDYNVEPAACKDTINHGGNPQADNPGGVLTETP